MFFCMAHAHYRPTPISAVHVGKIVRDTCHEIDMPLKEAAALMHLDPAQLSRALDGQAALDLWHVSLMPMRWWRVFLMKLSSALIVSWFDERVSETSKERRSA